MTALPATIPPALVKLAAPSPDGTPKLALSSRELAQALGVSVKTIERRRAAGEGLPPCFSMGDQTRRYPVDGVIEWMKKKCQQDGTE